MPHDVHETRDAHLTLPEAAARLRLSWPQAYRLALQGKLGPIQKVGRRWALLVGSVEEFMGRKAEAPPKGTAGAA